MFNAKMIMLVLFAACEIVAALGYPRGEPVPKIYLETLGLFFFAISLMIGNG